MDDRQRLSRYVAVWWSAVESFTDVLEALGTDDWSKPTDLPGWDVHACAAHTARLEAILAGAPEETVRVEPAEHASSVTSLYTEQGVAARRDRTPAELLTEIRTATTARRERLLADPPPGSTLVLRVDGHEPRAFEVDGSGRGRPIADVPEEPTVGLSMDRESFIVLAGGRREPEPGRVRVEGDHELAQRVLDRLAVTP